MQKIKGTYASAVIYSDTAEDYALAQVKMICDNEAAAGSKLCLMPDVHPGKVGPIGLTMTIGRRILRAFWVRTSAAASAISKPNQLKSNFKN